MTLQKRAEEIVKEIDGHVVEVDGVNDIVKIQSADGTVVVVLKKVGDEITVEKRNVPL